MDEWAAPFDEEMLERDGVGVRCLDGKAAEELMCLLEQHGFLWMGGALPTCRTFWDVHGDKTFYLLWGKRILYGHTGPCDVPDEKYTFYGCGDIPEIQDEIFVSILNP